MATQIHRLTGTHHGQMLLAGLYCTAVAHARACGCPRALGFADCPQTQIQQRDRSRQPLIRKVEILQTQEWPAAGAAHPHRKGQQFKNSTRRTTWPASIPTSLSCLPSWKAKPPPHSKLEASIPCHLDQEMLPSRFRERTPLGLVVVRQ